MNSAIREPCPTRKRCWPGRHGPRVLHLERPLLGGPATSGLDDVNPYVFIVGCPRSGTTSCSAWLTPHPQIAIVFETHWIPRWFEKRREADPRRLRDPEAR